MVILQVAHCGISLCTRQFAMSFIICMHHSVLSLSLSLSLHLEKLVRVNQDLSARVRRLSHVTTALLVLLIVLLLKTVLLI